jgi:4-phytase/acid phosphatase
MTRCATRLLALIAATYILAAGTVEAAPLHLVRVVIVTRHGVRPPTQSNDELAKYADKAWPAWPVAPGELTPHGGETVRLMGVTLREAYRTAGLLPREGCASAGRVTVWGDGADQRTRESDRITAAALQPGCNLEAPFANTLPRDPIFGGTDAGACHLDADKLHAAMAAAAADPSVAAIDVGPALEKLQAIFAPDACKGGAGTCFGNADTGATGPMAGSVLPAAGGLTEDLLLEYADGKPMSEVGWGRASAADIATVMALHERAFGLIRANSYATASRGAPMARVILAALAGKPAGGGPQSGPDLKLMVLAGHDTNLVLMAGVFGLSWTLPDEPDSTAPSTALAFELWSDGAHDYVRPVIYFETMDQLRTLKPSRAESLPLSFKDCASGPQGSCPLEAVTQRVEALLPPGCGEL